MKQLLGRSVGRPESLGLSALWTLAAHFRAPVDFTPVLPADHRAARRLSQAAQAFVRVNKSVAGSKTILMICIVLLEVKRELLKVDLWSPPHHPTEDALNSSHFSVGRAAP